MKRTITLCHHTIGDTDQMFNISAKYGLFYEMNETKEGYTMTFTIREEIEDTRTLEYFQDVLCYLFDTEPANVIYPPSEEDVSLYSILLAFVDAMRMDYNEKHYKEALKRFNDSHNVDMMGSLPVIHKLKNGNYSLTPVTYEQKGYDIISKLAPKQLKGNTVTQTRTRDKHKRAVYRNFNWDLLYDSCSLYRDFCDGDAIEETESIYLLARNLCGAENGKKHFLDIMSQREGDYFKDMNWKEVLTAIIKSDVPLASCNECQYCCFSLDDHIRLHWWCEQLTKRGIKFMQSNSYTPIIASLYGCYDIQLVQARRSINCNGDGRGAVNEVIIRNYI